MARFDGQTFAGISASTAIFQLEGGYYTMDAIATWGGGSIKLQRVAGDGTTLVDVPNASLSANGMTGGLYIAPGRYQVTVATATAATVQIGRVPVG